MPGHDVIVIGASSGGVDALREVVSQLPADLPASVFVVLHLSPHRPSALAEILGQAGPLKAQAAEDGMLIKPGNIYVARPDHHLIVKNKIMRLTRGPQENHTRPAIDPLFRSAAVAYGTRVVGVILSGALDDGTAGLHAIKRCGGITIVQDPEEALFSDMPQNALNQVEIDYVLPLARMGVILEELVKTPAARSLPVPQDIIIEVEIAETGTSTIPIANELGTLTPLTCTDCGGPLWESKQIEARTYRCNVGHAFTAQFVMEGQDAALERALWQAVRVMEQREHLLARMSSDEVKAGRQQSSLVYDERAAETREYGQIIRNVLLRSDVVQAVA